MHDTIDHKIALSAHRQVMANLRRRVCAIAEFVPPSASIDYLDIPFHHNVGDQLIARGAIAFFSWNRNRILHSSNYHRGSGRLTSGGADVIVLHGGGNIGDLYPEHEQFRCKVINDHMESPIVILPQTIHYSDDNQAASMASAVARHKRVTLFVRDQHSLQSATRLFSCPVFLCPDMVHMLYGVPIRNRDGTSKPPTLYIRRKDCEARGDHPNATSQPTFDWDRVPYFYKKGMRGLVRLERASLVDSRIATFVWQQLSAAMCRWAIGIFSRFGYIDSDRMHGHLLALLLDIPSTMRDNSYGKNRGYHSTWLGASPLSVLES